MLTESLIRQNQVHHQELLREAELHRKSTQSAKKQSIVSAVLASTGDLLVNAGQELQRRFRHMEENVALGQYVNG